VAHYPSDVAGCKVGVSKVDIVDMAHGPVEGHSGPSMVSDYSFRGARGAGGVEDVQIICAFHLLAGDIFELDGFEAELLPGGVAFYI